jgi:hypothetical protein
LRDACEQDAGERASITVPSLRDAMPTGKLDGTIEADEIYIEGFKRGMGRRYTDNKTAGACVPRSLEQHVCALT